ncbi:MAG: hypothetical protein Q7R67_00260 [bacterium]|nr:hypothetical protein [bacterium]
MRSAADVKGFDTEEFRLYRLHPAKLRVMVDTSDDSPDGKNSVRIWLLDDHGIGESCQGSILPMFQKYAYLRDVAERIGGDPIPTDPLWGEPWIDRWYREMTVEQIVAFLEEKLGCKLVAHQKS